MDKEYYKKYEPIFGSWYINREIGAGSYGRVFEIVRKEGSYVYHAALKAITIPLSEEDIRNAKAEGMTEANISTYFREMVDDFSRENVLMSKLKGNSNIVSYEDHQIIEHKDSIGWDILIKMELLTSLKEFLIRNTMSPYDVINLGVDISKALIICGKHNIIHRDIKPENIFISENGDYKLGDFGVSRVIGSEGASTRGVGATDYMAPEVVFDDVGYDRRADIYSLGLVLYQLLNGNRLPFLPPAPEQIVYRQRREAYENRISGKPIPPPGMADKKLSDIILKACAYRPEDRYSTPEELEAALSELIRKPEPKHKGIKIKACAKCNNRYVLNVKHCPFDGKLLSEIETDNPENRYEIREGNEKQCPACRHLFSQIYSYCIFDGSFLKYLINIKNCPECGRNYYLVFQNCPYDGKKLENKKTTDAQELTTLKFGDEKHCPKCGDRYHRDYGYCIKDGSALKSKSHNKLKVLVIGLIALLVVFIILCVSALGQSYEWNATQGNSTQGNSTTETGNVVLGISNPRFSESGVSTWDCIWFGNRKWRVLEVKSDGMALLLLDAPEEFRRYNSILRYTTWEKSTIRSWLNCYKASYNSVGIDYSRDGFLSDGFSSNEINAMLVSNVINKDNPKYGTKGGNNTKDRVFLLSLDETMNKNYGFLKNSMVSNFKTAADPSRVFKSREVKYTWWLRSPGESVTKAAYVNSDGNVNAVGDSVDDTNVTVRPALRINLKTSNSLWSNAGTVSSDEN